MMIRDYFQRGLLGDEERDLICRSNDSVSALGRK